MELFIGQDDIAYMQAGISKAGYKEIGFLGLIIEVDGLHMVQHIEILEQEVSSGGVDFDDEGFALYLERRLERGELPEGKFGVYSAHSHGNMSVFWSSTDEDGIKRYLRGAPYLFSSVFNTKGESKHRLDIGKNGGHDCPLVEQITFTEAHLQVISLPQVAALEAQIDAVEREVAEAAKEDAERDFDRYVRTSSYAWKHSQGQITKVPTPEKGGGVSGKPGPTSGDPLKSGQKQLTAGSGANGSNATKDGVDTDKRLVPDKHVESLDLDMEPHLVDCDEEQGRALFWYEKNNEVVRIDFEDLPHATINDLKIEDKYEIKEAMRTYFAMLDAYAAMTGVGHT